MNCDDFINTLTFLCKREDVYFYTLSKTIEKLDILKLKITFALTEDNQLFVRYDKNEHTFYTFLFLYEYTSIYNLRKRYSFIKEEFWTEFKKLIRVRDHTYERGWRYKRDYFKNNEECSICLTPVNENFTKKIVVKELISCGHLFHKKCIDMWSEQHILKSFMIACPMCRTKSKNTCLHSNYSIPRCLTFSDTFA